MKFQLFVLSCCVLQSIFAFKIADEIVYPPDVTAERVVGGEDAPDGAFPYQCSLQENKFHYCGCSIISNKMIITAAHCVAGRTADSIEVLVGTNDVRNGGTYYKVNKFYKHENYNHPAYANDIALIYLAGTIQFNDRVQPIELATEEIKDGEEVTLTGWGYVEHQGPTPKVLQMIKLKALSTESCKKSSLARYVRLQDSHVCSFTRRGQGACNGDSGGPLVHDNKLVGVVNFGLPCARGVPDGYAKISYFTTTTNWIKEHSE